MSVKLLVLNLPPGLNHEAFISAFAEFRGFLNGSLHLNPQNELYGIVEFSSFEFADIARKIRSNFKFMNSRQPINVEFFKSHDSFDYRPNQGPNVGNYGNPPLSNMSYNPSQMMKQGNFPNQNPSSDYNYNQPKDLDGHNPQGMYMSQQQPNYQQKPQHLSHYPQENLQQGSKDMYSGPQGPSQNAPINYNVYQGTPNQYMPQQQALSPIAQNIKGNPQNPNPHINLGQGPIPQPGGPGYPISPIAGANQNMRGGFPNPSQAQGQAIPQINPQQQQQQPNYGYIPQNQPNINPQRFGPTPQNNPKFLPQQQQMGNLAKFGNIQNKTESPNFSHKPVGKEDEFAIFKVPPKATSSIYVDGIPMDASEREVSHVFRPYPGYREVRLIKKDGKNGRKFNFCFVDFETSLQASIAHQTLQGYRFDKNDKVGLRISFAHHSQEDSGPPQRLKITKRKGH